MKALERELFIQKLGHFVAKERLKNKLTHKTLATKAGVSQTSIRNIELGCSGVSIWILLLVLESLKLKTSIFTECEEEVINQGKV